jgi:hypothetical protein
MNRCRFEFPTLDEACGCLHAYAVPKPPAQVQLDSIGREVGQLVALKGSFQMFAGSHIGVVSLGSAQGRLGIVFQEKIHPFFEPHLLALADNLENSIVPRVQPFAKFLVRFLPVLREG